MSENGRNRIQVLGVGFDDFSMSEAVSKAMTLIDSRSGGYVVTPNPEIVQLCRRDEQLLNAVNVADIVLADGIGILYGAKILGTPLKQKLPGIDFALELLRLLSARSGSVYLLGAKPHVAEKAAEELIKCYSGLRILGTRDGYFTDDSEIIADINQKKPDFLIVCLGAPRQELWMQKNRGKLRVGLMAGLGGSLDVIAGETKRAPEIFRKLSLEWFYRLLKEPRRIGRVMRIPPFIISVAFVKKGN